jgi:hypothetical protein
MGVFSTPPSAKQQQFATLGSRMANIETSQIIAEQTGGRAFYNTNDLGEAIRRAVQDTSLTYMLGYYPTRDDWDGRFREIKVRVRQRGVDVRHRKGYFAFAPALPDANARQAVLMETLKSPLEATGLGLVAQIEPAGAPDQFALALHLDGAAVTLQQKGGAWEGAVHLAIAQALPEGQLLSSLDTTVPLRFTDDVRGQFLKEGLTLNRTITLRPDVHQIRVVVRDDPTGALGSLIIQASRVRERAPQ